MMARKGLVAGVMALALVCVACHRPSKAEQYRAEKHERDSVALVEQQRSMDYYQSQLVLLQHQADSLVPLFKYEKNDKYQDRGQFVLRAKGSALRVMVRDDGQGPIAYRDGQRVDLDNERLNASEKEAMETALHLSVVISDLRELEKRIHKTSLEIEKYQKRLERN